MVNLDSELDSQLNGELDSELNSGLNSAKRDLEFNWNNQAYNKQSRRVIKEIIKM